LLVELFESYDDARTCKRQIYTLHVSDGLSIHYQESKTVRTASGICHTGSVAAHYNHVSLTVKN